jgi:hypothetical protein
MYTKPKHIRFLVTHYLLLLLLLLLLCFSNRTLAQSPTISYPVAAQELTRGYSQGNLTIKLVFNGICTGTTTAKIALPASVSYVAGSVNKTAGTTALSIAESSITDLSNPVFSITGITTIGDNITFTVARNAACGSLATAKDSVYVFTNGGCSNGSELVSTVNTYNILSPSLAITPAIALTNAVIGTTANRITTVTNGGNGVLDTLWYYVVYPGGGIVNSNGTNTITANGSSFTPSSTSGDTLFYRIYGVTLFGGDNLLSNGETVTITEPIKVVKCNTTTTYGAGWGKTQASQCQVAVGTSAMTMAVGVPNFTTAISEPVAVGACTPSNVTITITNTGTGGNAGALYNVLANIGNTNPNALTVVTGPSIITYSNFAINGVPVTVTQTGTTPYNINASQFSTDPDGTGTGLEDLDGDGQFDDLAPGKSLVITCKRNYTITPACTVPDYYLKIGAQLTYDNMCGTNVVATNATGGATVQHTSNSVSVTTPALVAAGTPFTLRFCNSGFNSTAIIRPTDSTYLEITLPAGLTYVGNGQYNGFAATVSQVGSVLYISYKGITNGFCFNADFLYTCGTTGALSVPYKVYYVIDRSCGAIEYFAPCTSMTINVKCPSICPGGMANFAPSARRVNYGYADAKMTTLVNPATLTGYTIKTGMSYDTFNIVAPAKEIGTYNNLYYYYQVDRAAGVDVLQFVSGTLNFKAGGTGATISCTMPAPDLSTSTATLTKFKWNFTVLLGGACGLPISLNTGDSIWVDMKYVVTTANNSALYGTRITTPANGSNYFYNLNASSVATFCDSWAPDIYLLGLIKQGAGSSQSNPISITGCSTSAAGIYNYGIVTNEAGDVFPGEYRPGVRLDSVVITLPAGISWTGANIAMTVDTFGSPYQDFRNTQSIPGTLRGNQIVLVNDGTWRMSDLLPSTYVSYNGMAFSIVANCAAAANSIITVSSYGKSYAYDNINIPFASTNSTGVGNLTLNYNTATKPAISVQNNTGVVQGIKSQQYWDVQVNNPSTQTAPYVWLALEKSTGTGNISIDSVVLKPSNVILTAATYNTTDKWYQASTAGLASGSSQQARVYFKYASCSPDSILLKSGWNCTGYPSPDPLTGYACSAAQTYLKVIPQLSQMQLNVSRQPGGGSSINLCTIDSALLVLNSAQSANLVNPYVIFYPPAGVTMIPTIQVEYPLGSGNYQSAAITLVAGGGYKIDLTAHSAIGANGILGTASANPAFTPLGGDRQAKIKLDFTTSCGFSSGSSFSFSAYGNQPCGSPATGNGVTATTAALNISGVTVSGSAGVNISFGSATSATCGTFIPVSLTTTPTSVGTSAGDTMVYTLPLGLAYAGGLTSGFTADTSGTGGATVIKIAMPVGVVASTPINYTFNVVPSGSGCGSATITGAYKRAIAALSCGGTPCTGSSVVIASATSPAITLNKPSLNITGMSTGTTGWIIGTSQTIHLTYNNTGTQASLANVDTVEFFCGSSTVPFAKQALTKSVAAGSSDYDDFTILVSTGACTAGNLITAKIQTTTSSGTPQCLCAVSSFVMNGVPLPLTFITTDITTDHCAADIQWTYNITSGAIEHFIIERSIDGRDFNSVATLQPGTKDYIDITPYSGNWYYRIKALEITGTVFYSTILTVKTTLCGTNTLKVYPNPTTGKVQIVLQGNSINNSFELIDALGRTLQKGRLQANSNNTVEISNVTSGRYMLKIISDESTQTAMLDIQK